MARASRIKVTASLQKQLEDNINFDEINYFVRRDGEGESKFFPEWENEISEEKLISIKSKNLILDTSGNKNLVHFPRKHVIRKFY